MLALFAAFGALGAGLLVEGFFSGRGHEGNEDDEDSTEAGAETEETQSASDWSLFESDIDDETAAATVAAGQALNVGAQSGAVLDGMPVSDDLPDTEVWPEMRFGGEGGDILSGRGSGDLLLGLEGDDHLIGRAGDDSLQGGAGDDFLHGEEGMDALDGGEGDDTLLGGAGDDVLQAGEGADSAAGQEGADWIDGGGGADTLHGGDGDDSLYGGEGDDWLTGGSDDDLLIGAEGADTLDGGSGDDMLIAGTDDAMDMLNGGNGADVLLFSDGDIATGGAGSDLFQLEEIDPDAPLAQIADYDPSEDELVLLFDPAIHADPVVSIELVEGTSDATIILDGIALAIVRGGSGLTPDMIQLRGA